MIKQITILLLILISLNGVSATSEQINETLFIYNASEVSHHSSQDWHDIGCGNIEKVVCVNCTCTEAHITIAINTEYDLEYALHYAPNDSVYYTTLLRVTQEVYDTSLFGLYKKVSRTLYVDSIEVARYNLTQILVMGTASNIRFKTLDQTVTFGSETVNNVTLFFTELVTEESYDFLYNSTPSYINYKFTTVGDRGYSANTLGGFTGLVLSCIKKIPFIGDSIYNVVYPMVVLIQYSIDASFLLLNLIMHDWWYAILLLECICMACALTQAGYINIMMVYVNTHISIFIFIYHKVMLPLITMFIDLLNTIKTMIKWW